MGWNSWNHFGCSVTEEDVKSAARALVDDGLLAAGYRYVNLDDCWQASHRTSTGELTADPVRFPHGIAALSAYVHGLGLKFGLYATPGRSTCGNLYNDYPGRLGSLGHEQTDARTFARWKVDYLKYDWCKADRDGVRAQHAFTLMRRALDDTGRAIVFSIHAVPEVPVSSWRAGTADLWRTTRDIKDDWASMISIAHANLPLARFAGPGHWNDPDMLEVGNGGMTETEYRTHFSLWCMMAAPLLLGNDLGHMDPAALRLVGNRAAIAVDQDPLGSQGHVVEQNRSHSVIVKALADGDVALSITNESASAQTVSLAPGELGLPKIPTRIMDLWTGRSSSWTSGPLTVTVKPHDTVMYRISDAARH